MEHIEIMESEDLRKKAEKRAEEKMGFFVHFCVYILVNVLLICVWWFTNEGDVFPWFIFPLIGWGIGLVAHFIGVYATSNFLEKMTEKELRKLKK
jgi:hypothetical protein